MNPYETAVAMPNKYLMPDGSIQTLSGIIVMRADRARAAQYANTKPRFAKWLMPDGSIVSSLPLSGDVSPVGTLSWDGITNKPTTFTPTTHSHSYEPANANIQAHLETAHAPVSAQKNSDITKAEIEAKLTGELTSHTHAGGGGLSQPQVMARGTGC